MRRNGQEVLSEINSEAETLRGRISRLGEKISETNSEIETLRSEKASIYLNLAELRYELLDDEIAKSDLYKAEEEAAGYLKQRQKAREDLDKELKTNQAEQKTLEQKRLTLQEKLDNFGARLRSAEEKSLINLEKNEEYTIIQEQLLETEKQIKRIDSKIMLAREDYAVKVVPYQKDPLFMYLWDRSYGTSAYDKGSISRMIDRWIADIVKYEPARRNYSMLSGIPEKLEIHKAHLKERLLYLDEKLDDMEQQQFDKDGVLVMREDYKKKRISLEDNDKRLLELENRHHEILEEKGRFSSNTDQFYSGAIQKLDELYQSKSLFNLRRHVAATPTQEDDKFIEALFGIEKQLEKLLDQASEYQSSLRQEEWRLTEIQNVRKTFKEKNYDSRQTTFRDGNMFTTLMGQFIVGVITNQYFWNAVGRLCMEVFDELDLDDVFDIDDDRRRYKSRGSYRSRKRKSNYSRSKDGFHTGGRF